MTTTNSQRPASGRASARLTLRLGTAIGPLALAMIALPGVARAQAECGAAPAGGTVTCTTAGNSYNDGITYVAQPADLTVVLEEGVVVSTNSAFNNGVTLNGLGALTLDGAGARVTTAGDSSNAIDVTSLAGPIDVTIGNVVTRGATSAGVRAIGNGDVTISTGNVTTVNAAGSNYSFLPTSTGILAASQGTGNVSVTAADVSTAGLGAAGVNASAVAGDVLVNVSDVETDGARANGVTAQSLGGNVDITTASVTTSGDNSTGILASAATGGVTSVSTAINTSGFAARGIDATAGAGGVDLGFTSVTTAGTLATGISAVSTGGDVTVSGTHVRTTGAASPAIYAASDVGDVNVTTSGIVTSSGRGGSGIYAVSDTGSANVFVNNVQIDAADAADTATSREAIFAQGASASVVATGGVTTTGRGLYGGSGDAITVTGTAGNADATVNLVRARGDGASAIVVTATGDASLTINGAVANDGLGADAVVVTGGDNATVTIANGAVVRSLNGNALTISSVNGSTLNNAGELPFLNNGYALVATGGPIVVNNSGTLSSSFVLTGGNDVFNNTSLFIVRTNPEFGAGNDVFNNRGTLTLGQGTSVTRTLSGLEAFNNSGLVDLRNGSAADTLVLPGTFTGSGSSTLGLDIRGTAADKLVIGGAATGSTTVQLNQLEATTPGFNRGTLLVQAGSGSTANAFTLAGGAVSNGLIRSDIVFNPANFTYSLTAGPSDAAYRTLNYVEGARNLWLKSADVVTGQLRARRDAMWAFGGGDPTGRFWLQMHGSVESRDSARAVDGFGQNRSVDTGFRQDYFGGQLGFDFSGGVGERGGFAFGVTGGYISSAQNFSGSADRIDYDAVNGGVYGSFSSGNLFANVLGKYDYYWADATSPTGGFKQDFKGSSYGARGEVGLRFGGDSFFVEPAASLSWVRTDFDDFTSQSINVNFDDDDGLRGKAGARIGSQFTLGGGPVMAFYAGGNYVHEFKGEDRVVFTSGGDAFGYTNRSLNDYGEGILGFTIGQTNGVSGFIEGSYVRSFKTGGSRVDMEGAGGRAGIRVSF